MNITFSFTFSYNYLLVQATEVSLRNDEVGNFGVGKNILEMKLAEFFTRF